MTNRENKDIAKQLIDDNFDGDLFEFRSRFQTAITQALDLKDARIKVLEDALRFYADPKSYYTFIEEDNCGQRARLALGGE